jgi:hypothetical protein
MRISMILIPTLLFGLLFVGCANPTVANPAPVFGHPTLGELWWGVDSPLILQDADASASDDTITVSDDDDENDKSVVRVVLFYIPNRVFDVFDIVRARLRFGLGIAVGVRATKPLTAYVGVYTSIWVGLHGPRGEPRIPWPVGGESRAGAQASLADVSAGAPHYGLAEFGLDFQLFILGAAVGVDPLEAVDFVLGFLTIDISGDDY